MATAIALNIGPGDLSPAKTLTAHALLNGKPSPLTFRIVSGPLTRLGVRLDSSNVGLLHLDLSAEDAAGCVVWRGDVERYVPVVDEIAVQLGSVSPECP